MTSTDAPRPDSDLAGLDVPAALTAGLTGDETARRRMFTDAAIAASLAAERLGVGPYPLRFLAGHVRSAGRAAALALPEPLNGAEPAALAGTWLTAAADAGTDSTVDVADPAAGDTAVAAAGHPVDSGIALDDRFAQWLDMVAALIAVRRAGGTQRTADAVS